MTRGDRGGLDDLEHAVEAAVAVATGTRRQGPREILGGVALSDARRVQRGDAPRDRDLRCAQPAIDGCCTDGPRRKPPVHRRLDEATLVIDEIVEAVDASGEVISRPGLWLSVPDRADTGRPRHRPGTLPRLVSIVDAHPDQTTCIRRVDGANALAAVRARSEASASSEPSSSRRSAAELRLLVGRTRLALEFGICTWRTQLSRAVQRQPVAAVSLGPRPP